MTKTSKTLKMVKNIKNCQKITKSVNKLLPNTNLNLQQNSHQKHPKLSKNDKNINKLLPNTNINLQQNSHQKHRYNFGGGGGAKRALRIYCKK
jgi:hypothetical protein